MPPRVETRCSGSGEIVTLQFAGRKCKNRGVTTVIDVARAAGVSPSTVSNVFNNPDRVREATRTHVMSAATQLGFRPNQVARSLRYGRSPLVAIIVADARVPFAAEVVRSAQEALIEAGRIPVVVSTDGDDARLLASIEQLRGAGVGSFLLNPVPFQYRTETISELHRLSQAGVTFAFISNQMADVGLDTITTGALEGSVKMVDHLVALGHERIALVGIVDDVGLPGGLRLQGFLEAMESHGLDVPASYRVDGALDVETGMRALEMLWDLDERPTAVMTIDDTIASGVLSSCHRRGIRVPDDLSVCGYNDEPVARHVYPPLTTLALASVEAGRAAAELLLQRIAEDADLGAGRIHHLEYELVVRDSTGPVPVPVPETETQRGEEDQIR